MHIEDTSHLIVGRAGRELLTNVFLFGLLTFVCIWLANKFNLVSKIGFFVFAIVFLFNTYSVIKSFWLTVVCVSNPVYSSAIKNRYMVAEALRITEFVVLYLLLSLLCTTLYGRTLINFVRYMFHHY